MRRLHPPEYKLIVLIVFSNDRKVYKLFAPPFLLCPGGRAAMRLLEEQVDRPDLPGFKPLPGCSITSFGGSRNFYVLFLTKFIS